MLLRRLIPVLIIMLILFAGCTNVKQVGTAQNDSVTPTFEKIKESADTLKNRGVNAHEIKDFSRAMALYTEALALYEQILLSAPASEPINIDIEHLTFNIAKLYIDMGFDEYGKGHYDNALENFLFARDTYAKIEPTTLSPAEYMKLILDLYKNIAIMAQNAGEYFVTLEYYDKILALEPANEEILNHKFLLLRDRLKDEIAAYEALKQYAKIAQNPNAYKMLALNYRELGNNTDAAAYFDKALSLSDDPTLINTVADFYRAIGQWLKSNQLYERFIATNPDQESLATAYKLIGDNYRQARNSAKMAEYFEKYLELERDPQIALLLASHFNGTKTYGKVVTYATMTLSAEPGNSDARMLRGIAYFNLKRNSEAKADFERLQNDPKYGDQARQFLKAIK